MLTVSRNGTNIASTSAFLNLMEVSNMFEHVHVENVTASVPPSSLVSRFVLDSILHANPTEAKQMMIFVHGINNTDWQCENSSETMFKRLYWSGYQGENGGLSDGLARICPSQTALIHSTTTKENSTHSNRPTHSNPI